MFDRVEFVFEPRCDQHGLGAGFGIGAQEAIVAGRPFLSADQYVLATVRLVDAQEITIVGLFIDEQVIGRIRTDNMMFYSLRPLVVVPFNVVKRLRVGRPDDRTPRRWNRFLELLAGLDRTHTNVVVLGPQPVHAVGDEFMVGAVIDGRDTEEVLAFALEVAIVEDRLGAAVA